ncbi:MAG: hypothetical protein CL676_07465 [Bdellovibrionaceae bacterium]|nr:hypothetical protein [Pseudobdellovibrionaceae bacterium]
MDGRVGLQAFLKLERDRLPVQQTSSKQDAFCPKGKCWKSSWMDESGFVNFKSQDKELMKLVDLH